MAGEIETALDVGFDLCLCLLQDGRPTKGGLRVCPSANGTNLRPELTLFCVGFLTSPSSAHQLSSHSLADLVIYTNAAEFIRFYYLTIHSLLLLYFP